MVEKEHRGVALDHPANAAVLAALSAKRPAPDRAKVLHRLETLQAHSPDAQYAEAIRRFKSGAPEPPEPERLPSLPPGAVDPLQLGTHPDIIDRLWAMGRALPGDCRWISYRQPVLVHDVSGIVFGLGIGTLGFALRLPPTLWAEAGALGAKREANFQGFDGPEVLKLERYGPDWWFGRWEDARDMAWARAAYDHFGAM